MENCNNFFESFDVPDLSNISHPDQNPAPATTTTPPPPTDDKPQLSSDQPSWFSSYYSTDGTLEQLLGRSMNAIPQDQPMKLESDGFRSAGRSKTDAEIACENYQREYSALPNNYAPSSSSGAVINPSCGEPEFDPTMHFWDFEFLHSGDKRIIINNMLSALLPPTDPPPVGQHPVGCISSDVNATYSTNNLPLAAASLPSPPLPLGQPNDAVDATDGGDNSLTMRTPYWNRIEHDLFLVGLEIFGKGDWKNIAEKVVITKSHTQVASHAQKFFMRQNLPKEKRKRTSIHDINTVNPLLLMKVCARLGLLLPRVPDLTQQRSPNFDDNDDDVQQCLPSNHDNLH